MLFYFWLGKIKNNFSLHKYIVGNSVVIDECRVVL